MFRWFLSKGHRGMRNVGGTTLRKLVVSKSSQGTCTGD